MSITVLIFFRLSISIIGIVYCYAHTVHVSSVKIYQMSCECCDHVSTYLLVH